MNDSQNNLPRNCVTYFTPGHLNTPMNRNRTIGPVSTTGLKFSPDGSELLAGTNTDHLYLYDLNNARKPLVRI